MCEEDFNLKIKLKTKVNSELLSNSGTIIWNLSVYKLIFTNDFFKSIVFGAIKTIVNYHNIAFAIFMT